jgi:hypothetical protein
MSATCRAAGRGSAATRTASHSVMLGEPWCPLRAM